jgi:glycosyltransferase involved in cell wall biosynthesis
MESVLKKDNVTCIIPFYNEDESTIRLTLYSLLSIPEITQIIVIDDGSDSKMVYNAIVRYFSHRYPVNVIRIKSNLGKSTAVSYALNKCFNENILLVDADLDNVYRKEFLNAISKYKEDDLDMLILMYLN